MNVSNDAPQQSLDLSNKQKHALRRAARNGEYHLMLGAGSSLDSKMRSGRSLPGSSGLIQELCAQFGVSAEDDDLLWRVYDRAIESAGEDSVYAWLRQRFWDVEPPYWMEYYARSPWSTVWTLNIDDTFEAAYRSVATDTMKPLETLNWDDDYRQSRRLAVIHLHGVVDQDSPRELVFSLREYAGSAAAGAAWPTNFRDTYGNSPFVILGARLRDEPDIEAVISRRNPSHPAPSFYVARTISPATRADLIRWGLVPVEMTAEDFVLEWERLTGFNLEEGLESELELGIRIGQQFSELRSLPIAPPVKGHDLLGGDEPFWSDIQNGLPADLEWITKAKMDCSQIGQSLPRSTVLAYTGRRLTGRSTGLLQLGHHLRSASWRTFLFRKSGRVDVEAILGFAADGKSLALLFDGMADVSDDVDRLITESRKAGLNIVCIAVDEPSREANIIGRVHAANLGHSRVANINGRLSRIDAARLVDKLSTVGRLGIIESDTDTSRIAHFRGRDLFDSMAELENAPGFGRRVNELLEAVTDNEKLNIVLIAAYASFVGQQLLVVDAARIAKLESDSLVRRILDDTELSTLLATDGKQVRTRHRWMALTPIVSRMGSEAALAVIGEAIRSVSSRLGRQSLRERNPTSLLVGAFMKQRNLRQLFSGAPLDPWYASLLDIFGSWSGRYWEQRAILARWESRSDVALLAKAESFALRAAELVPDTYSYTTLGTVLLEKAAHAQVDVGEYYARANSAFDKATKKDSGDGPLVTWMAFLRYSVRLLQRLAQSSGSLPDTRRRELREQVREDWIRVYAQLAVIRDSSERVKRDLSDLRRDYDALQLTE